MIGLNRAGLHLCNLVEMFTVDASFHCLPVITVSVVIGGFMYGFALKIVVGISTSEPVPPQLQLFS